MDAIDFRELNQEPAKLGSSVRHLQREQGAAGNCESQLLHDRQEFDTFSYFSGERPLGRRSLFCHIAGEQGERARSHGRRDHASLLPPAFTFSKG